MARRPRQRQERQVKSIEIQRNVIEKYLMDVKEFARKNPKPVLYAAVGLLAACAIAVAIWAGVSYAGASSRERFEEIVERMAEIKGPEEQGKMDLVIRDLKAFIDSTYFGFPHSAAHYVLGNIYYDRRDWAEAKRYLVAFADSEKKNVLAPVALLKAALALEESGDLKAAVGVYRRLDEQYPDCAVADQVYYNYARACAMNGDLESARIHYNKVIAAFPDSPYVQQARKRLFLLGAL